MDAEAAPRSNRLEEDAGPVGGATGVRDMTARLRNLEIGVVGWLAFDFWKSHEQNTGPS